MAMRILKPLVRWGGYYPSKKYTPLVYPGGYTTMDAAIGPLDPLNTFSGDIVRFTTKRGLPMQSVKVNMSPIQDLHGYDSPWPEGGGANKLPPMEVAGQYTDVVITASGETYTLNGNPSAYGQAISSNSFTLPAGTYYFKVFVVSGSGSAYPQIRSVDGSTAYATIYNPSFTLSEATELKARFTWDASLHASNLVVRLMIVTGSTEPTAWTPCSNICPISGYTGVEVWRDGANLFDQSQLLQATGWAFDSATGFYYGQRAYFNIAFSNGFPLLPKFRENTQYTISLIGYNSSDISSTYLRFHYTDGSQTNVLINGTTPQEITATSTSGKTVSYISGTFGSEGAVVTYIKDLMLSEGSTATDYEPYQGNSYSVTFPPVNIWDEEWESGYYDITDGSPKPSTAWIRSKNDIHCASNTKYCARQAEVGGTLGYLLFYKANGDYISSQALISSVASIGQVFTTPNECQIIKLYNGSFNVGIGFSINYPSFETGYHAHTEPLTVYGGTPDIVNGEMIIDRAIKSGMTRWSIDSSGKLYQIAELNDARVWALTYEAPPIISTALPTLGLEAARQSTSPCITQYSTRFYVGGYIGKEAELDALLQSLEFVYELANPVETKITSTPVTALFGYNNVWSDAGPVEVVAYGTPIEEPDVEPLGALGLLLGGAYRNDHTPDDVSDEEALDILLGGADR